MHHPPHIFLDDSWYAITAATLNHEMFLSTDRAKALVRDKLQELIQEFKITLRAWVILDNHYHLLLKTHHGDALSHFFRKLHGGTAFQLNGWDNVRGRQIWHNYWDTCIRNEKGYWTRFNYIHNNPIKHGYVDDLMEWPFSSYHYYLKKEGMDWINGRLSTYPLFDYNDEADNFEKFTS